MSSAVASLTDSRPDSRLFLTLLALTNKYDIFFNVFVTLSSQQAWIQSFHWKFCNFSYDF